MTLPRALDSKESKRQRRFEHLRPFAERQRWRCPWCHKKLPRDLRATQKDHIIPVARGGPDADWNLQLLHGTCNGVKRESLTAEAIALAAEHGVTLLAPAFRPPRPSRYTTEQVTRMATRRAAGERYEAIGADYGCTAGWVYELIRRHGLVARQRPIPPHAPFIRGDGWKWVS